MVQDIRKAWHYVPRRRLVTDMKKDAHRRHRRKARQYCKRIPEDFDDFEFKALDSWDIY